MPRDGFQTAREAVVQSIGTIEVFTRVVKTYNERTHKGTDDIQAQLNAASKLIEWTERLQADLYELYEVK